MTLRPWLLVILLVSAPLSSELFAQPGAIRGRVTDPSGNPIEGVDIEIQAQNASTIYRVKTKGGGDFIHAGVRRSDTYRVVAKKEGYQPYFVDQVKPGFNASEATLIEISLTPGDAGAPLIVDEETRRQFEEEQAQKAAEFEAMKGSFDQGLALMEEGQSAQAAELFKVALEKDQEQPAIWANLAMAYSKLRMYDQAVESYEEALLRDPENAAYHQNLGNVYSEMGETEKAQASYTRATESVGGDPTVVAATHYNMGVTHINAGRNQEAIEEMQKAIEADPNHADAHYQLGLVYVGTGQIDDAVSFLSKYLELAPDGANAGVAEELVGQLKQ